MLQQIDPKGWVKFSGITDDSRTVKKGDIFFAIEGPRFDGNKFIDEAVRKGAALVVTNKGPGRDIKGVRVIEVDNPRIALAEAAAEFYGRPSSKLKVIGITGTNGKTTVAYLLKWILKRAGYETGIIGTISHNWKDVVIEAKNTTPGAVELQRLLSMMAKDRVRYCAMEVSSHSLDQERVYGIDFDAAIFTNITPEHLDYHKTFENYLEAKLKLFRNLKPRCLAIINADDENFEKIIKGTSAKVATFSVRNEADVFARDIQIGAAGSEFTIVVNRNSFRIKTPLIGVFNISNISAAVCYALKKGIPIEVIKEAVSSFKGVEGRFELVTGGGGMNDNGFNVFVDYAHTDDALENALKALRMVVKNRLVVVFGCGGDRDRSKRPRMGWVASKFADYAFITSDNPRSEDPSAIVKEIESGLENNFKDYRIILDRREAISEAIKNAGQGDIVIIAGKGHERYQIVGDKIFPFSDCEVAREILESGAKSKKFVSL